MTHADISATEIEEVRDAIEKSEGKPKRTIGYDVVARHAILASRAALLAEGKKVVAREPTEAMLSSKMPALRVLRAVLAVWRAMWDAAP